MATEEEVAPEALDGGDLEEEDAVRCARGATAFSIRCIGLSTTTT